MRKISAAIILLFITLSSCTKTVNSEDYLSKLCDRETSTTDTIPIVDVVQSDWDSLYVFYPYFNVEKTTWETVGGMETDFNVDFSGLSLNEAQKGSSILVFLNHCKYSFYKIISSDDLLLRDASNDPNILYYFGYHNVTFHDRNAKLIIDKSKCSAFIINYPYRPKKSVNQKVIR